MAVLTLPFGPWIPDQELTGAGGLHVCRNALPYNPKRYICARGLSATSQNALAARCIGALAVQDKSGVVNVFAGTTAALYRLNTAGGAYEDVSKAGGYSTATDPFDVWSGCSFGERLIMTNFTDAVQSFLMGSSTDFADLGGSPPKAKYAATIQAGGNSFVMLGYIDDASDGVVPQRVHWSAVNNAADWPAVGTNDAAEKLSDRRNLYGDFGFVQGLVGQLGNANGAAIMQRGVFRITYVGSPAVFQFDLLEGVYGTPAPQSIAPSGSVCYFLTDHGFVAFDGITQTPIGTQQVDDYFWGQVNRARLKEVWGAADPANKLVYWVYPSTGSAAGYCDRIIAYRTDIGQWSEMEISAELVFRTLSIGYTLEGLDCVTTSLDDLTTSLDSDAWVGGRPQLGFFDTSHRLAYQSGDVLAAEFETKEYEDPEGRRIYIGGVRPMIDLDEDEVIVRVGYREAINGAVSYTASGIQAGSDGVVPIHREARYPKVNVRTIAGSAAWTQGRGVQVHWGGAGKR